jgi:hypothetical protein
MKTVIIPEHHEVHEKYNRGESLTKLERLIHDQEPAGELGELFRVQLAHALADNTREAEKRFGEINKCECGKECPADFLVHDNDGNATCPSCLSDMIEERIEYIEGRLKDKTDVCLKLFHALQIIKDFVPPKSAQAELVYLAETIYSDNLNKEKEKCHICMELMHDCICD